MKKIICTLIALACLLTTACSYLAIGDEYTVSFDYRDGREIVQEVFTFVAKRPQDPLREGYAFDGWYTDTEYTSPFDFNSRLSSDVTLYAKWLEDPFALVNGITDKLLTATVKITVIRSNRSYFGTVTSSYSSLGSGVIFKEDSNYYYVLTNSHVVEQDPEYTFTEYTVGDAYGGQYGAGLIAADPAYDLAVLKITKVKELAVAELAESDPIAGEQIISIGNPSGLINAVNQGEVKGYSRLEMSEGKTTVEFPALYHTAPSTNGSSGGGLFDTELRLVGINFAVSRSNDEFLMSYSIPIEKVREFLTANSILLSQ